MNKNYLILAGCLSVVAFIGFWAWHNQHSLEAGLPPRIVCKDMLEAFQQAVGTNLKVIRVAGTGSMAPWIPAAKPREDPMKTIVAFIVVNPKADFDSIVTGNPCVYTVTWNPNAIVHCAASKDAKGWIMSGLHNARSESDERMTKANFLGRVERAFVWP